MILERVEKDGLIQAIYDSSNIVASSYDKNKKELNVTFKNGGNYTYQGVPETDYLRFETADSQGKVLNTNIKVYPALKHESVDVDSIVDKVKEIKREELGAMLAGISEAMVSFNDYIESDEKNPQVIDANLKKVYDMITVYYKIKNN
jgi:hypothetical protein